VIVSFAGRMLASAILKKVVISILLSFLKSMALKSDNDVDDKMVVALAKALNTKNK